MRDRIIRFVHEYAPDVILVLSAIAIFVVTPKLASSLFSDSQFKSTLDITLKLLGTFLAVTASIASYRRFFRGRIFAPRLKMGLVSRPVRVMSDDTVLHGIDIEVNNVGSVTVWNPRITIDILHLDSEADCTVAGFSTEGIGQRLRRGGLEGIEPGELVVYHYRCRVPGSVEAFRILVDLTIQDRHAWHRSTTVSNAPSR